MAAPTSVKWTLRKPNLFQNAEKNSERRIDASNIIFVQNDILFVWDNSVSCFRCFRIQSAAIAGTREFKTKTLTCSNPPLFVADVVVPSSHGSYVAIVGKHGITVMQLLSLWGPCGIFEEGKEEILCKAYSIDPRYFTCRSSSTVIKKVRWHPGSEVDTHLIVLSSNCELRVYDIREPDVPIQCLQVAGGMSRFAAALGEVAVSFDVSPQPASVAASAQISPLWPIYVLTGTGDVYVTYSSLQRDRSRSRRGLKLVGPLAMLPTAYDNYGVDACDILCLATCPPVLVVTTCAGLLYHCVVLQGGDECDVSDASDSQLSESSLCAAETTDAAAADESLYVYDSVEIELTLSTVSVETDAVLAGEFSCPVHLLPDCAVKERYHCYHAAGVHTVVLPWITKLEQMAAEDADSDESPTVPATAVETIAEHVICTKPLSANSTEPPLGVALCDDGKLGALLLCLFADFECIALPLRSMESMLYSPPLLLSRAARPQRRDCATLHSATALLSKMSFDEHIRSVLSNKAATCPFMRSSDSAAAGLTQQQLFQILTRATMVFREEYIQRLVRASGDINHRVTALQLLKKQQRRDLDNIKSSHKILTENARELALRFDDIQEKQEVNYQRVSKVLRELQSHITVPSDAERALANSLRTYDAQVKQMAANLEEIKKKAAFQMGRHHGDDVKDEKRAAAFSSTQIKHLKDILSDANSRIRTLMSKVKHLEGLVDT